jgi:hypothetical protein
MTLSVRLLGAATLAAVFGSSCLANAQTVHHRARHPTAVGHAITVHRRESFLTAGTGASVGAHNAYVLDTLKPPQRDTIQGTFVGQRGLDRLPNQFSLPGSNVPLFHVSLPAPGSDEPLFSF